MELYNILRKRRSQRKFTNQPVSRDIMLNIINGTLTAPSSKNVRSSRFMLIEDRATIEKIAMMRDHGSSFVKNAPAVVLVMGDRNLTDLWIDNCAISATIMQLCAEDQGLGSCWVHINARAHKSDDPNGMSAEEYLRTFLDIPESYGILCAVAIGYTSTQLEANSTVHSWEELLQDNIIEVHKPE